VQGVAHLRDLLELVVGLAALLSCLQSDFVVIHKRFVHAKLAGQLLEEVAHGDLAVPLLHLGAEVVIELLVDLVDVLDLSL